ncbi:hypothetical protein HMN09_01324300 [Mycena chlorophos]|uniref:Uncharacterized protein n=1 Tax=Mycena chlorophos TaxID=658473 RepID=A0A8H6VRS5_MYCCL|nr:hypothetical protein HMN09_01324300 [Mycena chlorophos]
MAAPAAAISTGSAQMCDYCHQKPKHGNHPFCSKTCAAQIATLCNHCHQKPKYQNFEYCGKNCAAAAAALGTSKAANTSGLATAPANSGGGTRQAKNKAAGAPAPFGTTSIGGVTIDPMQIAKLVAQHIPQVQTFMNAVGPALGQHQAQAQAQAQAQTQFIPAPAAAPVVTQRAAQNQNPKNNPFVNTGASLGLSFGAKASSSGAPVILPAAAPNTTPAAPNGAPLVGPVPDCLIPGCGQPVHVDATTGNVSEYCSKKHREEAVTLGIAPACIMCLVLPQSDTDYFCGRECREEALSKHVQAQL